MLRSRGGGEARVEPVELFFDLVFVFAITQLSHRLIEHPTATGAIETLLLLVAIWWSWIFAAWVTNWLDPHRTRVRLLLFVLMATGLVVSMSIPEAFGARGRYFAFAYVATELIRSAFTMLAMRRHDRANFLGFARILVWQSLAAIFWILGAFVEGDARIRLWLAAMMISLLGPILYFPVPGLGISRAEDWSVDPHHLAERCGLFVILSLGESILIMGATFAALEWSPQRLAGFGVALAGTVALWWLYFNIGAVRAIREFVQSAAPGRVARLAYTYLHLPIVAGIIISAAAVEWVAAHPDGHVEIHVALAATGGPGLYLLGVASFKRATGAAFWPLSHLVGLGGLAALALAAPLLQPWQLAGAVVAMLIVTALWETRSLRTLHEAHAAGAARRRSTRSAHPGARRCRASACCG